jgi:Ricin-type beta-trefoil lectin domain
MSAGINTTWRVALRQPIVGGMLIALAAGAGSLLPASQALAASQGASATVAASTRATPSATGPIASGYRTAKCVDDSGDATANDTPVVIGDCNGSAEQTWAVESDGTIQINGKCLDIFRDRKINKSPVELWTCTGGANQQWQVVGRTLVNPVSGKCLDDPRFNTTDGTQLETFTCNGGANQKWQLP